MKEFLKDKKMRLALTIIMIAAVAVIGVLTWWAGGDDSSTNEQEEDSVAYDLCDSYELNDDVLADSGDIDTDEGQDLEQEEPSVEESADEEEESTEEWSDNEEKLSDEYEDYNEVTYTFRYDSLLESHYEKHGIDMGFASEEEYLAAANAVINNPDALHKIEAEDGDDVYYVEATNEFVVVAPDGYIRTYFLPDDGIDYYNRQ